MWECAIANLKVRVLAETLSFSFCSRMPSRNCFFCLVVICPLSLQNTFMVLSVFSYPQNALSVLGKREVRKAHPESWVYISMRYNWRCSYLVNVDDVWLCYKYLGSCLKLSLSLALHLILNTTISGRIVTSSGEAGSEDECETFVCTRIVGWQQKM